MNQIRSSNFLLSQSLRWLVGPGLWLAWSSAGFAGEFHSLKVLPDNQRPQSKKGAYVYVFVETFPQAASASLYSVACDQSNPSLYQNESLLGLVEAVKGSCQSGSNTDQPVEFVGVGSSASRLCLRLPLEQPLNPASRLSLDLRFFQSREIQGKFYLGRTPDFDQAVEIFAREPAGSTSSIVKAHLDLKGADMEKFLKGTLGPQTGELTH